MFFSFYDKLGLSTTGITILSISIMLFAGFALTRITKLLKLPNVTAYIIAGILIGPSCLNLVPTDVVDGMGFLADISLAFIAFSTGEFFKLNSIKKQGGKMFIITIFESLLASLLIFLVSYFILKLSLPFSVVLGALAAATASASTMMTIRQTKSKGEYVDTLLQVIAFDNVIALIAYSVSIVAVTSGSFNFNSVGKPILLNIGVLLLGGGFGYLLKLLMPKKRTTDNRLIIAIACLFTFCGICSLLDVSPLLGCMSMGMIYINVTKDDKLFKQLNYFSPPILLLFFVRSGASFKLDALVSTSSIGATPLIVIAIVYFFVRMIGKYVGSFLGCMVTKKDHKIRNYLGLALIPQAGVAIGLAAMGARILGGEMGSSLETIILASSILYELIGPVCAKLSLYLNHSYNKTGLEETKDVIENEQKIDQINELISKITEIQETLPEHHQDKMSEEEKAFLEAAEEQYAAYTNQRFKNKR